MRTVPALLSRSDIIGYVYALEISPSAADSWLAKRFATNRITIDGDEYDNALAKSISRIVQSADIIEGGNIAKTSNVTFKLINESNLHEDFLSDLICGRESVLLMSAIGPNRCLNSTFGNYSAGTPDDFDNWTETLGTGGGEDISADLTNKHDSTNSVSMTGGLTTESKIQSDTYQIKRGERATYSFYVRGNSAGGSEVIDVVIEFNGFYWNVATAALQIGVVQNSFTVSAPQTWERFDITFDWSDLGITGVNSADTYIRFTTNTGTVQVDAIQIEGQVLSDYCHNRYELLAADTMPVMTATVTTPKWDFKEVTFVLEPSVNLQHCDIPTEILTEDYDVNWVVPRDSVGKPFPMTYGDFNLKVGYPWEAVYNELESHYNCAAGLLANEDPDSASGYGIEVYFDRPTMKCGVVGIISYDIYHYDKKAKKYYKQLHDDRATPLYVAKEFISGLASKSRFSMSASAHWLKAKRFPLSMYIRAESLVSSSAGITNPSLAFDQGLKTYAQNTTNNSENFVIKFQQHELDHTINLPPNLYFIGDVQLTSGTGIGVISFTFTSLTDGAWAMTPVTVLSGASVQNFRNTPMYRDGATWPLATHNETSLPVTITAGAYHKFIRCLPDDKHMIITMDNSSLVGTRETRVFEFGIRQDFAVNLLTANYGAKMIGRRYMHTWNARKTATGTIRGPIDMIESMLRYELGAVDADIDMTAFDAAWWLRLSTAWLVKGQLLEQIDSKDWLKKICFEFGLLHSITEEGKHTVVALGNHAAVDNLTLADFVEPHTSLKMELTERDSIITQINAASDKVPWESDDYWYSTTSTRDATAYAALGNKDQVFNIKLDWLHKINVGSFVTFLQAWRQKQRIIISGDLFMSKLNLTLGTIVTVDLPGFIPVTSTKFVVTETRIKRSEKKIGVILLEVL